MRKRSVRSCARGTGPTPPRSSSCRSAATAGTTAARLSGSASAATCATPLPREEYVLPFAAELRDGLAAAARADRRLGPYGEPIRELIARNRDAVEGLAGEIERLAAVCRADPTPLVLTHGEPN